jgi:DsbC/DsbD-like thiol-disulfide interchange protein
MFQDFSHHLPSVAATVAAPLVLVFSSTVTMAADTSPWASGPYASMRLIAGQAVRDRDTTTYRAGVEIKLKPGWKTYWRHPGDSGVPPRFNFAESENVRQVEVRWPAPRRFAVGGEFSIGYSGEVIFPLRITAVDPARPVTLRLHLDYAVCEKLCVPVDAKAELVLTSAATAHDAALAAAEARVPKPAVVGEGPFTVRGLWREPGKPSRVVVDLAVPAGRKEVDLFAEGPTPDWALPLPQPIADAPAGLKRFAFLLDGVPPGARAEGALLRLTAVADPDAIEVSYRLDEPRSHGLR